jgi:cytoskeletal protein CcmA (bactofilin family)
MSASPVLSPNRRVRCPICGSERLQLRTERDHIDRLYQTTSDRVRRLFAADRQLYHCRVCRLQFYDNGQAAQAAEKIATVEPAEPAAAPPVAAAPEAGEDATAIGRTVTIKGRLSSQENILVDGEIEGDVEMPAHRLTVGISGRMRGDVVAAEVIALGTVEGSVDARRKFDIHRSASMTGNIRTPSLTVAEGATFKGKIETA